MAYDQTYIVEHDFDVFDFGGGAVELLSFRGPPGMIGTVLNIGVAVTEVFLTGTANGSVQIGTAGDADAYGKLNIASGAADVDFYDVSDDTDAISAAVSSFIPADQLIRVTLTNGTDAEAVTGQGHVKVTIRWARV